MASLSASVGQGGRNLADDVRTVQQLLRSNGFHPGTDGNRDAATVAEIRAFQARFMAHPDGLIEPGHRTWQQLIGKADSGVSGQWQGDSSQWPQDKKLASLKPEMAAKVRTVLDRLAQRGFQPRIVYGWRSVAVQAQLVAENKSKVRFSFHNAQRPDGTPHSYAADIIDSRFAWSDQARDSGFWQALGDEAHGQGLVWGGEWKSFPDWAHVQLVANSELPRVMAESGL